MRSLLMTILVVATLVTGAGWWTEEASAGSPNVVISQVYGGGGNSGAPYANDFIELFNRGTATVSLAGWSLQYASATGTGNFGSSSTQITPLAGAIGPGQYLLVQEAVGANPAPLLPTPDVTDTTPIAMAAGGAKVALVNTTTPLGCNGSSTPCSVAALATIVDLVGWDGANFYEGSGPGPTTSNTTAALRQAGGCQDTDGNSADFFVSAPAPRNTASPLHSCEDAAPSVLSVSPADGADGVSVDANLTVTFSEPVNVSSASFSLVCGASGAKSLAVSGGPTTFTLNPSSDFAVGETCMLTVFAAGVSDQDTQDPPDTMVADFTSTFSTANPCVLPYTQVPAIQGDGPFAAITGAVTTEGVVVGDFEGPSPALRGFYLQDPTGDGNAATSDGIFVFDGNNDSVDLGDVVRVSGTAADFQDQTQISASQITMCGVGTVAPTDVTLPVPYAGYLERYEGMLVRMPQTLTVTEHFQLGRFGQIVMSAGGRLLQPTNVVVPGAAAVTMQAANDLDRIIVDDPLQNQNPDPIIFGRGGNPLSAANTLRGGDTATGMVGVMTYTWAGNSASGNAFRLRPVGALGGGVPLFSATNPRSTDAPSVGGTLRIAGMNLLNFFNTFDGSSSSPPWACTLGVGGALTDCRGADDAAEFARQWPKTVAAIVGTGADVVAVSELENDGYGPDSAIRFLVDRLNEATAPGTYAFVDADAGTGQVNALGTDAIKVGILYEPAAVTPVGTTAALNSAAFVNGGDTSARNRPALAQAFKQNATGAVFVVVANHLKSKGSACDAPDTGDGQGNCAAVRTQAAHVLAEWLSGDPTGTGSPNVLILGDLNSYAKEDPITALTGAGFTDLVAAHVGVGAYSYAFDGQWGYLDHALGSPSLAQDVTGVAEWHVNADEPSVLDYNDDFKSPGQLSSLYAPDAFRMADHDPVLVGLDLNVAPVVGPLTTSAPIVPLGSPVALTAPFTDANTADTHTAVWSWGDGSTSGGAVAESAGSGTATGSHVYGAPAVYRVVVTITDDRGLAATAAYENLVVYDPNGGFVTGGGWIGSPSGKTSFSFAAKYKKGATVPTGTTELQLRGDRLNFHSTSYEWLVVAGASAQLMGHGTIDGSGDYTFRLWAGDGSPDTLHIRITGADGSLVYDNGTDQPLGGGSIVIHE